MSENDAPVTLSEDAGLLDKHRLFTSREIWTFAFVGLALVVVCFTQMWGDAGLMSEDWSGGRWLTILACALYGLVLGWMLFPRTGGMAD